MVSKSQAEYVHPPGASGNYYCSECAQYNPRKKCWWFSSKDLVQPYGSCNKWRQGRPSGLNAPEGLLTPEQAGYVENKAGYGCRRCTHMQRIALRCTEVDARPALEGEPDPGIIHPCGCCDLWVKHPDPAIGEAVNKCK